MKANVSRKKNSPRLLRAAIIATGVVVFLVAFRPFGLAIDSVPELLVLLGVAPVCFLIMAGIHYLPLRKGPLRTTAAIGALISGNSIYLMVWSTNAQPLETTIAVTFVAGLTVLIVFLWNRGQIPEQDIDPGRIPADTLAKPVILSGDGGQEILQMDPNELLFLKANGNYVDVHYLKDGMPARSMLRSSLAGLATQVPGNRLIRCHRSYFVNFVTARRIRRVNGRTLVEFDSGEQVPVSRTYRQAVRQAVSA